MYLRQNVEYREYTLAVVLCVNLMRFHDMRVLALIVAALGWASLFIMVWQSKLATHTVQEIQDRHGDPYTVPAKSKDPIAASKAREESLPAQEPTPFTTLSHSFGDYDDWGFRVVEGVSPPVRQHIEQLPGLLSMATTECEAQAECRRLGCSFVWQDGSVRWACKYENCWRKVGRGQGRMFVLLRRDMAVEAALAQFEQRQLTQISSTAHAVGNLAGWSRLGGKPVGGAWCPSTLVVGGVSFKALALSHEAWVEANRRLGSTEGGVCESLKRCARLGECAAASYRVRDGFATLYASARVGTQMGGRLERQKNKDRRLQWLYVKNQGDEHMDAGDSNDFDKWYLALAGVGALSGEWRVPSSSKTPISRVIVSLTTLPDRLAQLEPVLRTLLFAQSRLADEVRLNLPQVSVRLDRAYVKPEWLDSLVRKSSGRLLVHTLNGDYGPATKLVPSVRAYESRRDVLIVVVDDDTLYPSRVVEILVRWADMLGDQAAVAASGWPAATDLRSRHWTENYLVYGVEVVAPHPVAVIRGNCGFAVRPSHFDQRLWTEMSSAPPGAVIMDDVWISGHLARRHVLKFVVPLGQDQVNRNPRFTNITPLDHDLNLKFDAELFAYEAGSGKRSGRNELILGRSATKKSAKDTAASRNRRQSSGRRVNALINGRGPSRSTSLDRSTANDVALDYFRMDWDVFWSPKRGPVVSRGAK